MRALIAALLLLTALPARADDAASCRDGIAMIKAELAKSPAEAVAKTLRKELRVAERELGEKEYDECLDAVRDARRALSR
ncbi:hypothetical protein SAMN04487843_12712 [Methylobacterium sp. ap11]|uniref:hypothetical protein n=1 Tax=Methylobacterium sp. ap11 TaxID=1761799 RepID=UPI0008B6BA52|nr:hypothetical protein [Methylobacterium sp. ap11]SEP48358.1 hypothetical protein SAMN04487843_12712 [Methylobacterium sp. ap11]